MSGCIVRRAPRRILLDAGVEPAGVEPCLRPLVGRWGKERHLYNSLGGLSRAEYVDKSPEALLWARLTAASG